jgi:hypothetical protein
MKTYLKFTRTTLTMFAFSILMMSQAMAWWPFGDNSKKKVGEDKEVECLGLMHETMGAIRNTQKIAFKLIDMNLEIYKVSYNHLLPILKDMQRNPGAFEMFKANGGYSELISPIHKDMQANVTKYAPMIAEGKSLSKDFIEQINKNISEKYKLAYSQLIQYYGAVTMLADTSVKPPNFEVNANSYKEYQAKATEIAEKCQLSYEQLSAMLPARQDTGMTKPDKNK